MKFLSKRFEFSGIEEAQEYYFSEGLTDGLPVVIPTESNVADMLAAVELLPGDLIADEKVRGKRFVAETIAINAVMAGCKPEYMPIVIAAVKAISASSFNFHANSTSTNGVGILAVVSGKISEALEMNSGTVLFGHGNRANATIGRALGLIKINAYGSRPHEMDKSTLGHPGKYTFCFAENEDVSPWEPLRVEKGFSETSSTVTAFAASGPLQVTTSNYREPEEIFTIIGDAAKALGPGGTEMVVVLSPEILQHIARSNWTKYDAQEFIFRQSGRRGGDWNSTYRTEALFPDDRTNERIHVVKDAESITILAGGGMAGPFASVIGCWGGVSSVTKEI